MVLLILQCLFYEDITYFYFHLNFYISALFKHSLMPNIILIFKGISISFPELISPIFNQFWIKAN